MIETKLPLIKYGLFCKTAFRLTSVKIVLCAVTLIFLATPELACGLPLGTDKVFASVTVTQYYRTELYFGRSIPGGGMVSDDEREKFLAEVVTPRFPDGFTIVKATGQYREQNGKIDKEPSEVLIFLYPAGKRTASRRMIEEIRRAYVSQFRQESVLRLDFANPVVVRF